MHALDLSLFHWVNNWCGTWALDRIAGLEEHNALLRGGVFMILYWWFWFAGTGERREANRRAVVGAIAGTLLALVLNRALASGLPFRTRPMYVPDIGYHAPSIALDMNLENWSSFPSDTATFFEGLGFGLFALSRWVGIVMTAYAAVWICLTRIYLGIHYPSDILGGALLGIAVVWAVQRAFAVRRGALGKAVIARMERWERFYPAPFYAGAFAVTFELSQVFDDVRNFGRAAVHELHQRGLIGLGETKALYVVGALALLGTVALAMLARLLYLRRARRERPPVRAAGAVRM